MMMGNEPVIALFHKKQGEAGRFGRQGAVFVPQEIIEADRQYRGGIDDFEFMFAELHFVAGANHNLEVISDGFPADSQSPAARAVQDRILGVKFPDCDIVVGIISDLPLGEECARIFGWS